MSYKFRAECRYDVDRFLKLLSVNKIVISSNENGFPDVEVQIESDISLDQLRNIMRNVANGHVMVQTINHASEYTGERNYHLY